MIINKRIKKSIPVNDYENIYVITDFDRTITSGGSKTSWSILSESNLVPTEYKDERNALYKKYRPIELDEEMNLSERNKLIRKWYLEHIELFIKYKLTKDIFENATSNLRVMEFRNGAKEFIKFLHNNNIPLIIISAGIGNFIECFLKHNDCYYDNVYISSNKIIFKNNVAFGVDCNIIHSLNKNEVSLPDDIKVKISKKNKVLLLGDQISDLKMIDRNEHKEIITVGFATEENNDLERFKSYFDIVCEDDEDYNDLMKIIFPDKK